MASVLIENFEGFTNGQELNGAGQFTANGTNGVFKGSSTSPQQGSICSKLQATAPGNRGVFYNPASKINAGVQGFYMKEVTVLGSGGQMCEVEIQGRTMGGTSDLNGDRIAWLGFYRDGAVTKIALLAKGGTAIILDASPTGSAWYKAELAWDTTKGSNGQVRARVSGANNETFGSWTAWTDPWNDFASLGVRCIGMQFNGDANTEVYFDNFYDGNVVGPTTVSKVSGVAAASIGKVSGVAWASVKKISGQS